MNCEMEDGDIRYISEELRKTLKGYRKSQEKIKTYKGHLIKDYNLKWLKSQNKNVQDEIMKELDYNIAIAEMMNGRVKGKVAQFDMSDTMEIPLVPNKIEKEEMER